MTSAPAAPTAYTAATRVGTVLNHDDAAEAFFGAAPGLRGSPHLHMLRRFSLAEVSEFVGGEAWLGSVLAALSGLSPTTRHDRAVAPAANYEPVDVPPGSAPCHHPAAASRWGMFEVRFDGPSHGNPFVDVAISASFRSGERTLEVPGFYDGAGTYVVRVMADQEGDWTFRTHSNARSLDGITGAFTCGPPAEGAHGPVRVHAPFHFAHADGTPFHPFGTTLYAWTHQGDALEERTLATLAASPFNKVRMGVFPKHYSFNTNEPERHAFPRDSEGRFDLARFDLTRFDPEFFRHLERRIADLARLGIQADLILFHPYDRWGYAEMPPAADDRYLRYVVARVAAFANVWWSLANEYDFCWAKDEGDWERFGTIVSGADPHGHLLGVHNGAAIFDHSRPWVTHASIQKTDDYRTTENTDEWRARWGKPVIVDEYGYEGDIDMIWGNVTAEEVTRRAWEAVARGGYSTHGETYADPDDVLWWAKGGTLHGASVMRIAFLRSVVDAAPFPLEPDRVLSRRGYPAVSVPGRFALVYLSRSQPRWLELNLQSEEAYQVDVLDTWNMTTTPVGVRRGTFTVDLPGRPYLALRLTVVDRPPSGSDGGEGR